VDNIVQLNHDMQRALAALAKSGSNSMSGSPPSESSTVVVVVAVLPAALLL